MFHTLFVYQRPAGWDNVKRIAEAPRLLCYVQKLEIAALPYLPASDFEVWKKNTRPLGLRMADDSRQKAAILMERYDFLPDNSLTGFIQGVLSAGMTIV